MRPDRFAVALFVIAGCGGTRFEGTVQDVAGAPLPDSRITAVGTLCQGPTDASGAFALSCGTASGAVRLIVTQTGYVSKELEVDVTEAKTYDLGTVVLIRIPDTNGLFLFDGAGYASMEPGYLGFAADPPDNPRSQVFCLDRETSPPNRVKAGSVPLYEKAVADDWKLFRLDADGCARRMTREGSTWSVTWSEHPAMTSRDVERDQVVHIAELTPGAYFLAWWRGGTFVTVPASKTDPKGLRMAGYHLVAE